MCDQLAEQQRDGLTGRQEQATGPLRMPSWPALRGKVVAFRRRERVPCWSRSSKLEILVNIVIEQTDAPGEWAIGGLQDDGAIAGLFYSRDSDSYALGTDEDEGLYSFNLTSPTTVSGCYYEILSSTSFSSCYPMTGVRAQPNTTAAHAELGEIEEAAGEFGNEVQIEVVPKIIRVLEDLREVLRQ